MKPYAALFDTHTHFDVADFDQDRELLAYQAKAAGVERLILIGIMQTNFQQLIATQQQLNRLSNAPQSYLAPGLHPFYIEQHQTAHLDDLAEILSREACIAIGEIGLDTFLTRHKNPELFNKQKHFFSAQIELAQQHNKPILLHIRKAHADVLQLLKYHHFKQGGIAHAFSGGIEEAKALVKLGFKLGVTGQITNPNAKKLHTVVKEMGAEHLVIETDCPDMTPQCCQIENQQWTRNVPANLPAVLDGLAQLLHMPRLTLAAQLWKNSNHALGLDLSE